MPSKFIKGNGPAEETPFRVLTLGQFQVVSQAGALQFTGRAHRKPLELLKVLIALGGENVHEHVLSEALWPDADGDRAHSAFNSTLHRLRGLIGAEALPLYGGRLTLNPEQCWTDASAFAGGLELAVAAAAGRDGTSAWLHLEQALALYRGPFLEGEFAPPEILTARQKLHGLFLRHLQALGEFFAAQGEEERAFALYQRVIEMDPLAEEFHQELMRACLRRGRPAEGVAAFQRCREALQAGAGTKPSPESAELHQALLALQERNWEPPAAPGEHSRESISEPEPPSRKDRAWLGSWLGATALLVLGLGGAGLYLWNQAHSPERVAQIAPQPAGNRLPLPGKLSIVVLPFVNLSGDPGQEHIADGITDDLITDLSRIRGAFVIARGTSFTFKGKAVDTQKAARELGVRYVLEGSVRRSGSRVRVNTHLIDGATGNHIWSDRFDREFNEVFSLQNEVTGRIASALNLELVEAESRRLATGAPASLEAWDYALRGWAELFTKGVSKETTLEAKRLLAKALALDPNSALAWTATARLYAVAATSGFGFHMTKDEAIRHMLNAAQRAVALDPKSENAHRQLGFAYRFQRQYDKAESACHTALKLNPNYEEALLCLGLVKIARGKPAEAIPLLEQAFRLNPLTGTPARNHFFLGQAQLLAGHYEQAVATVRKGIAGNPKFPSTHWVLASSLGLLGRQKEAAAALAEFNRVDRGRRDTIAKIGKHYRYVAGFELALEGLRRAGMPET